MQHESFRPSSPQSPLSPECSPSQPETTNRLLVIYFNGVSCMGKSELLKRLTSRFDQKSLASRQVSLDKIAKDIMDDYKTQNDYKGEEAFTLCMPAIFSAFHQNILESAKELSGADGVLMVDDCSLDQKLMRRLLERSEDLNFKIKFFRLYPEPYAGLRVNNDLHINLSFQFVLNLCYRALNRGFHHTFNYVPEKKLQLVLSFVRVYELRLEAHKDEDDLLNDSNHSHMQIEFHHEKDMNQFGPQVKAILKQLKVCLQSIIPFESPVVTARDDLKKLVDAINLASAEEIKPIISYGRSEMWEQKFDRLHEFFQ